MLSRQLTKSRRYSDSMTAPAEMTNLWIGFNRAEKYHISMPLYTKAAIPVILDYYREKFPNEEKDKIPFAIDLACGTGHFSELLSPYCDRVLGLDVSPQQIEVARRKSSCQNVDYNVADVYEAHRAINSDTGYPFKADIVTTGNASHYFNNPEFYAEMRKVLKHGGILAETVSTFSSIDGTAGDALTEHNKFWRSMATNDGAREGYNRMFDMVETEYHSLNVMLEEREIRSSAVVFEWRVEDFENFMLYTTVKTKELLPTIQEFYRKFWEKFSDGRDSLSVEVKATTVFSRNLNGNT